MSAVFTPSWPAGTELAWPEILPDHLSPSSLKLWMRCRESWRRKYLDHATEPSSHYFVWGAAHNFALVETNYAQKITSGVDLPLEDVKLAFAEGMDRKIAKDGEVDWGKTSAGEVKDGGVALVAAYHTLISPSVQPIAVEEHFTLDVPGVPVPLTGYLDVLTADRTLELKTAAKRELAPADVFQGRVYQLARPATVDFHIATKTKVPAIYTMADYDEFGIPLTDAGQELTARMVRNLVTDILATLATYGPEATWPGAFAVRSTCNLCGHRSTCDWWTA